MNELLKTLTFVVVCLLLAGAAAWTWSSTQPVPPREFELVGQEFFPDFVDPLAAKSIEVKVYDEQTASAKTFSVVYKDGLWRLPSHYDYPAEAAERLARTATSLFGLKRESLEGERESEHEKYAVLDPDDASADTDTAGKRITLRDEDGSILCDYLIGNGADTGVDTEPDQFVRELSESDRYYYVRVPGETETYRAEVDIDLSTRFRDWIQPDLLKLDGEQLTRLEVDTYELVSVSQGNQIAYGKSGDEPYVLTHENFVGWEMEGLDVASGQLDQEPVEALVAFLDELEIVGVRPKPTINGEPLVLSDLSINMDLANEDPGQFQIKLAGMQEEFESKGFIIGGSRDDPNKLLLLATNGELKALTDHGVAYSIYFGNAVSGDESEVDLGSLSPGDDDDGRARPGDNESSGNNASSSDSNETGDDDTTTNRYVAIRVDFDPAGLGEMPVQPMAPSEPQKPAGYDAWKADSAMPEQATEEIDEASNEGDAAPDPPEDIQELNDQIFRDYETALASFEQAQIQYETDLELYETNTASRNAREKAGRELVDELNDRFGQWYYVIPTASIDSVLVKREALILPPDPKLTAPFEDGPQPLPVRPDISPPTQSGSNPPAPMPETSIPDPPNTADPEDSKDNANKSSVDPADEGAGDESDKSGPPVGN